MKTASCRHRSKLHKHSEEIEEDWLVWQSAFVEHQRAVQAGTRPRRTFQGRHAQTVKRLGEAVGELLIVAFEQKWRTHRLLFSR